MSRRLGLVPGAWPPSSRSATRSCLDAGLVDEIVVNLVPVILGTGIPFLAGSLGPVRLEDPEVTEAEGVTQVSYSVRRAA
jgi:dihydrofolate reductase